MAVTQASSGRGYCAITLGRALLLTLEVLQLAPRELELLVVADDEWRAVAALTRAGSGRVYRAQGLVIDDPFVDVLVFVVDGDGWRAGAAFARGFVSALDVTGVGSVVASGRRLAVGSGRRLGGAVDADVDLVLVLVVINSGGRNEKKVGERDKRNRRESGRRRLKKGSNGTLTCVTRVEVLLSS